MIPGAQKVAVRLATSADAVRIAGLSDDLGYPNSVERIAARIERYLQRDRDVVFVAVDAHDNVIGWIHGSELDLLETGRRAEILGLVVDQRFRGQGIGRTLVDRVETWAKERGLALISVRSNVVREQSHPFYERLGYARAKTQHVYRKQLLISD